MNRHLIIIFLGALLFAPFVTFSQSLTLEQCKKLTLQNNAGIEESKLNVKKAEQVKKEAFTNYFPSASISAMAIKPTDYLIEADIPAANLPVYNGDPANLANPTQFAYFPGFQIKALDHIYTAAATVTQPIYAGGQIRNGNRLASVGVDVSKTYVELSERDQLLQTETWYWQLTSAIKQKETILKYEKLLNQLLKDVTLSQKKGLIQKSDLLKVQLKLTETSVKKTQLNNAIEALSRALCQHIGLDYNPQLTPSDVIIDSATPESLFISPDSTVSNMAEIKLLEKSVEAANLEEKIAIGKNLPSLAVGGKADYTDITDSYENHMIGFVSLSIPLTDWWKGSHQIKQKEIESEKAKLKLKDSREKLSMQQTIQYNQLVESWKNIDLGKAGLDEATEHLQDMNNNYEAGLVTVSDLLEAQAIFQEAESQYQAFQYSYLIESARYKSLIKPAL